MNSLIKFLLLMPLFCLLLASCNAGKATSSCSIPAQVPTASPTYHPVATPTPPTLLVPEPPKGFPTAEVIQSGKDTFFQEALSLNELIIFNFLIRKWSDRDPFMYPADHVYTISAIGQPQIKVETVYSLNRFTGTDITGAGVPDVIFDLASNGNWNNEGEVVYELGATPRKVLDLEWMQDSGQPALPRGLRAGNLLHE